MAKKIIPIFVPHEGCPHDCIFCNQTKITGVSTTMTGEVARKIIEEALETIPSGTDIEIAFFGGSFTAIEKEKQVELLSVANEYKEKNIVQDIRMSTRPDCIDEEELALVKKYGATIIELGVQSMDDDVLVESLRGHSREIVVKSAKMIKDFGITLGLQMMIGLPTDSEEKCIRTAKEFIKIKPSFVRIYPTLVIKETGLETAFEEGLYRPFEVEESVEIVKKLMVMYSLNDIGVIRVGLQATDDIQEGIDVVAGPYHPAFRELVTSRMVRDYMEAVLDKNSELFIANEDKYARYGKNDVVVYTANKNMSTVVGNKKCNRKFINEKYKARFKTKADEDMKDSIRVELNNQNIAEIEFSKMNHVLKEIYGL